MTLSLPIYDEEDKNVVRVAEGECHDLTTGVVIDILEILKIDSVEQPTIFELSLKVLNGYKQVTNILHKQFPDITKEEWRRIRMSDLMKVLLTIVEYTLGLIKAIPDSEKK